MEARSPTAARAASGAASAQQHGQQQEFEYEFPSSSEGQRDRDGDFETDSLTGKGDETAQQQQQPLTTVPDSQAAMAEGILRVASGQDEDINELAAALRAQFRESVLRTAVDSAVNMKMRLLSDAEAALAHAEAVRSSQEAAAAGREHALETENRRLQRALEAEQAWHDQTVAHRHKVRSMVQGFQRTQAAMCRRAFAWWRSAARREGAARVRVEAEAQLKAVTSKIVARYEQTLAAVAADLAGAQAAAEYERARGMKLEDDLRRALLRGMTTMNMEAMHIFNENRTAAVAPPSPPPAAPPLTPAGLGIASPGLRVVASASAAGDMYPRRRGPPPPYR